MLNSDLMQFKDDILKTLRELEKKIMLKVNKSQTDLSLDINIINDSIKLLKNNNNSIIESITEQKVSLDKISEFEILLKKMNNIVNGHENKISDTLSEISYIRNRCERAITETFTVPGIIGNNCKFSTFNDYIIFSFKGMTNLKSEKDFILKESKDLRQKLEHGLKKLSNTVDTYINRAKLYTDATKKIIIELMDNKIGEIEGKSMELIAKVCKIDIDTEQKVKNMRDEIDIFIKEKSEQFQKMEDKLLLINYNVEEVTKKYDKIKEEINSLYSKEKKNKNDINELKNMIKKYIDTYNMSRNNINQQKFLTNRNPNLKNNLYENKYDKKLYPHFSSKVDFIYSNNLSNTLINNDNTPKSNYSKQFSSPKNKSSKYNGTPLPFGDTNYIHKINNNMNPINTNLINNNFNNNEPKNKHDNKFTYENNNQNNIFEENIFSSEEISQTYDNEVKTKDNLNKNIETIIESSNNSFHKTIHRKNTIDPKKIINKNKKLISFDLNKITEEKIRRNFNLHKTFRTNKVSWNNNDLLTSNLVQSKINENKEEKITNKREKTNKNTSILEQKINKSSEFKNTKINHNSPLPLIRNKHSYLSHKIIKNKYLDIKNRTNIKNNNNNLIPKDELSFCYQKTNNQTKNRSRQMNIDIDTGIGCNVIKLSLDGITMSPYNTNGLLTIASKKYINKHLIKMEDSSPLDDIYLFNSINNLYQTYRSHSNSRKKNMTNNSKNNKISRMLLNNSPLKKDQIFVKNKEKDKIFGKNKNKDKEEILEKEASKTINQSHAYLYGKVKFHF